MKHLRPLAHVFITVSLDHVHVHASNHGHVLQSHVGQYFATSAELYLSGGYGFMLTSYLAKPHLLFFLLISCPACVLCAGVAVHQAQGEKKSYECNQNPAT